MHHTLRCTTRLRALLVALVATVAVLVPLASTASAAPAAGGTITIGSKDFTEQFIMGELYAQALQHAGFTVKKKINLGSTTITDAAVRKGDIDIYPEYTGTMLL